MAGALDWDRMMLAEYWAIQYKRGTPPHTINKVKNVNHTSYIVLGLFINI